MQGRRAVKVGGGPLSEAPPPGLLAAGAIVGDYRLSRSRVPMLLPPLTAATQTTRRRGGACVRALKGPWDDYPDLDFKIRSRVPIPYAVDIRFA